MARNGTAHDRHSFHWFFEHWLSEQSQYLEKLVSASKETENQLEHGQNGDESQRRILRPLIERVLQHYEHYYNTKSTCAKSDVLSMFNPSWRSSLEDAFLWVGGWRPTMAFHLLYSKSGIQLEANLMELIQGLRTGDLSDLSQTQLERMNQLQEETVREEKKLTEKLAKKQESVADSAMVELSHMEAEMARAGEAGDAARVEATLAPKKEGLLEILQKADELRLKTLKQVLRVLNPVQGVHFLIAAAELHLRLHEWGQKRDARRHHLAAASDPSNPEA